VTRYLVVHHGRFGDKVEQYSDRMMAMEQFVFAKRTAQKSCSCSIPPVSLCEVIAE
jgi:hypothetical protein